MTATFGTKDIGALIRARGLPTRPVAEIQVSEIRSDQFVNPLATLEQQYKDIAMSSLVTEWRYTVPYPKMEAFHAFLAANEAFIAAGVKKVMSGVSYHGTYMGAAGQRNAYRTLWGYDSWESNAQWAKVVEDPSSQLFAAVRTLRSYWVHDAHATQEHLAYAAAVKPSAHPFINLTIQASKA